MHTHTHTLTFTSASLPLSPSLPSPPYPDRAAVGLQVHQQFCSSSGSVEVDSGDILEDGLGDQVSNHRAAL